MNQAIVRHGFRQTLRTKKFWIAVVVTVLPLLAGVILFIADGVDYRRYDNPPYLDIVEAVGFLVLSGSVPLTALLLAGGMIADDIEDRTLTYLLVRPIKRAQLYLSKLMPVVAMTAALGAIQALLLGLTRVLSWVAYGKPDVKVDVYASGPWAFFAQRCDYPCTEMVLSPSAAILAGLAAGAVAAALLGAAFAAMFGFISLLAPRFHFLVNLLLILAWELPFGHVGGRGLGFLTFTYHASSLLDRLTPGQVWIVEDPVVPWFAFLWVGAWAVAWGAAGMRLASVKDFPVSSATT